MSVVQASVDIEASPEDVWKVVADPRNLPKWDRHIVAVRGVPPDGLHEDTRYESQVRFFGARAWIQAEVLELRRPEYSKIRLQGVVVEGTAETSLEPLGDRRTRLRHRVDYRFKGGPLGRLAAQAVRIMGASVLLRRGTLAQKSQVEGSSR